MLHDVRVKVWLLQVAVVLLGWWHEGGGAPLVPAPGQIRVLIVDDVSQENKPEHRAYVPVLTSATVKHYLNTHCHKTGDTPDWRQWDVTTDISNESPDWQPLMAIPRESTPWLIIESGHNRFSGPLPATVDDTLKLLKKWGGE